MKTELLAAREEIPIDEPDKADGKAGERILSLGLLVLLDPLYPCFSFSP